MATFDRPGCFSSRLLRPCPRLSMFVFTALIGLGTGGRSFATEVVMTGPADAAPLRSTAYTDTSSEAGSQVRSDGNGLWICVFSSDDTLNDTIDTDFDLLYVTSTDDGASWSDPSPLNTNAVGDNANDVNPQLATDGAGTWIVVWRTVEITGTYNPDGELAYSRSLDNGQSWSPPAVLNSTAPTDGATNDAGQKIATNGAGAWVCVWTADPLTGSPDILCTYSLDNGQSWSSAATVNSRAAVIDRADARPSLATDGQGTWMCVWDSNDNFGDTTGLDWDIMYAVSTNDGQTWSDQAPLNSNAIRGGDDTAPAVASDGRGTWVVTWLSHDSRVFGGDSDVAYAVSTDLGATWSDIAPIHPDAAADWNADEDVKIETDGKGRWVVVWESWNPLDGLIGNEQDLLFAVSTSPAIGWSAPAPLNSYAMFDDEQNQDAGGRPATDGHGRWIATWTHHEPDGDAYGTDHDILFTRFELYPLGDLDRDADVDASDFARFLECYSGSFNPPAPSCRPDVDADLDDDGDVDLADFSRFSENFTGAL